jgi:hypothetical protein
MVVYVSFIINTEKKKPSMIRGPGVIVVKVRYRNTGLINCFFQETGPRKEVCG